MVKRAADFNPFSSTYFFWVSSEAVSRPRSHQGDSDHASFLNLIQNSHDRILLHHVAQQVDFQLDTWGIRSQISVRDPFVSLNFLGGSSVAVSWFFEQFYESFFRWWTIVCLLEILKVCLLLLSG